MAKLDPSISRDGKWLLYSAFGGLKRVHSEVRLENLVSGEEKIIPMRVAQLGQNPRLSPDGSTLSYRDWVEGRFRTFIMSTEETTGHKVCDSCQILGFFPDPNFALVQERSKQLLKLNLTTGKKTLLLEAGGDRIKEPSLSPDGRWLSFVQAKPDGDAAIYVVPLSGNPRPESDWILLFEEDYYLGSPVWSPNGNRLYYLSERDGYCSVWMQKLDPQTKKPVGNTENVYPVHNSQIQINLPPGNGKLAVAEDKLALWISKVSGNIYMATPKKK